jgi:hypothetical protein
MRTQGVFQRRGGICSIFCLLLREGLTTIPTEIVNHLDAISADRFLFFCKLVSFFFEYNRGIPIAISLLNFQNPQEFQLQTFFNSRSPTHQGYPRSVSTDRFEIKSNRRITIAISLLNFHANTFQLFLN